MFFRNNVPNVQKLQPGLAECPDSDGCVAAYSWVTVTDAEIELNSATNGHVGGLDGGNAHFQNNSAQKLQWICAGH